MVKELLIALCVLVASTALYKAGYYEGKAEQLEKYVKLATDECKNVSSENIEYKEMR